MNTVFSLKRFGMLFKKHTIENYKGYLMSFFVLIGILILVIGFTNYHARQPMPLKEQYSFFMLFFLAGGTIFTSTIFANLGDKRKAIAAITLPASTIEKFMVGWIYSFVLFQLIFTGVYYLIIIVVLSLGHWPAGTAPIMDVFSVEDKFYLIFVAYAFLHACVIYGAIYFKNMHFIKTAFAFFIIVIVLWLLNDELLKLMTGLPTSSNPPFTDLSVQYMTEGNKVDTNVG